MTISNLSERRDSNSRPSPWQGDALPTELLSLVNCGAILAGLVFVRKYFLYFLIKNYIRCSFSGIQHCF